VLDELGQFVGFLIDGLDKIALAIGVPGDIIGQQSSRESLDRSQRSAQFMRESWRGT